MKKKRISATNNDIKSTRKSALSKSDNSYKNRPSKKEIKKPFWFYLIIILIPVVFFILLEISLRISNYGIDTTQWVKVAPGQIMLNPDVAYRYFHSTKGIPNSNNIVFAEEKGVKTIRIFIVGASSAAGFPYSPNGDFGQYIKKKFEVLYPELSVEVINIGLTATNTYAIRDLIPGVLELKPDLILIYAGHNEYYGALGVGSMESIGRSRTIVNFVLSLEKYKTFVLIRDILMWAIKIFSIDSAANTGGTLMSRMAKDKLISFNSDIFNDGIDQFEGNMRDVFTLCKNAGVPVIIGTLTSNLKDQIPFVSVPSNKYPNAGKVFNEASVLLKNNEIAEAIKKFRFAKDLDGLRFRAPEIINSKINLLAKEFNYPLVPVDYIFNSISPYGIVGNNLMVDHLHPTRQGYRLMGKIFFNTLRQSKILPQITTLNLTEEEEDRLVENSLYVSKLDSVVAKYRILILKNDWPFSESKSVQYMLKLFNADDFLDSIALKVIDNKIIWEKAHRDAAARFLAEKNYKDFIIELNVLIDQYPFIEDYIKHASEQLLAAKLFNYAYPFLKKGYQRFPGAFYSKWLGIIDLSANKVDSAIKYLNYSLEYQANDPQVLFNLAGAYSIKKDYQKALSTIENCLKFNPNYPQANALKLQLMNAARLK